MGEKRGQDALKHGEMWTYYKGALTFRRGREINGNKQGRQPLPFILEVPYQLKEKE